jgi:hypothetical protein
MFRPGRWLHQPAVHQQAAHQQAARRWAALRKSQARLLPRAMLAAVSPPAG